MKPLFSMSCDTPLRKSSVKALPLMAQLVCNDRIHIFGCPPGVDESALVLTPSYELAHARFPSGGKQQDLTQGDTRTA